MSVSPPSKRPFFKKSEHCVVSVIYKHLLLTFQQDFDSLNKITVISDKGDAWPYGPRSSLQIFAVAYDSLQVLEQLDLTINKMDFQDT